MGIKLTLTRQPTVPLEAEALCPDTLADCPADEIAQLTIYHGKRQLPLSDFFEIEGEKSDEVEIHGDLKKVRWIGRGMSRGHLKIQGDVGMHLGAYMRGGSIEVKGNAGDWIGAEMKKGTIRIDGNAGGQIGAAYRGSRRGMRGGLIHVTGSAGLEVGMRMRRGIIVIGGSARDFTGLQMKGGTIVLGDGAEIRTGAWMNRGTIISLKTLEVMPTFGLATRHFTPPFMPLLAKALAPEGITLPENKSFDLYNGDLAVPGRGELLVLAG